MSDKAAPEEKLPAAPLPGAADADSDTPPPRVSLLPLCLVPLLIALAFATVTLLFSWLALGGADPGELVRELGRGDRHSWRQAVALVQLLRDPQHAHLRQDRQLALELAGILRAELDAGAMEQDRVRLRSFLCRALGQFQREEVLPLLIAAAGTQRDAAEMDVRRSALEAIAEFLSQWPPDRAIDRTAVLEVVLDAAQSPPPGDRPHASRAALRATAAFALGVLGDDAALTRLVELLADPEADVRYNAATGLARYGRAEAEPVLLEMLESPAAWDREPTGRGQQWKRQMVLRNALRSVDLLAAADGPLDARRLIVAVRRLAEDSGDATVQRQSRQTLRALQAMQSPAGSGYDG